MPTRSAALAFLLAVTWCGIARAADPGPPQRTAELLGQTPDQLQARLGQPALRRPEGGEAEVWLYAAPACALDLVLYRDTGGALRVAFAAARGAEAACLGRLATGSVARPAT